MSRNSNFNPDSSKRRVFFIELYPDSTTYNFDECLNTIKTFPEYAFIFHDKDVHPTGELKKVHVHAVIRVKPCLISTILNKFPGLEARFVEYSHDFRWCLRYLLHLDDVSKFQYPHEAVVTNIADIESYWRTSSEWSLVFEMVRLRQSGSTWYQIFQFSGEKHCYDVFRRNFSMISVISGEAGLLFNDEWDETV